MKFDKKVAVVTGGTTGIGNATCERLKKEGAIVYNLDINEITTEDINFINCDVRNYNDVQSAIDIFIVKKEKLTCYLPMLVFIGLAILRRRQSTNSKTFYRLI